MKVSVELSVEYKDPYVVIYADEVTDEIQRVLELLRDQKEAFITALEKEENIVILQPKEIYMVRVEAGETIIFGEKQKFRSRKRLYELEQQLGRQFMQISKSTIRGAYINITANIKNGPKLTIILGTVFVNMNYLAVIHKVLWHI